MVVRNDPTRRISLINEGNFTNFFSDLRTIPQWKKAWNAWLAKRYPERAALATAWAGHLQKAEDTSRGTVDFPDPFHMDGGRARDCMLFLSDTDSEFTQRMIRFVRETGEITIDGPGDDMILDTPRTAGGYGAAGQTIRKHGGALEISMDASDATVWVSSLDGKPIAARRRLLLTHLTDLQNSDIRYGEASRQTLLAWGRLPHLVRAGGAKVKLRIENADNLAMWALSAGGRRIASVPCSVNGGVLQFNAMDAGDSTNGARFMYEIAER